VGLVGLGGHADFVCRTLLRLHEGRAAAGDAPLALAGAYDPDFARFPQLTDRLRRAGVTLHRTYAGLLASEVEAVWLPVPIDLHRRMTVQAAEAGKAVLCEKPAAGCVQDVDAMIRARDAAGRPVAVAFQDLYARQTWALKRRLLAGEIGAVRRATVVAAWPRAEGYFLARQWSGRVQRNGVWILDSPANNAMAHFLHLTLFLLGPAPHASGLPTAVEAELYRVNGIENYDTCCLRAEVDGAGGRASLLAALTHASRTAVEPVIVLEGERGELRYDHAARVARLTRRGAAGVEEIRLPADAHDCVPAGFAAYARGGRVKPDDGCGPHASLEMARAHAVLVSGASQAAPVRTVAPDWIGQDPAAGGAAVRRLEGPVAGGGTGGGALRYIRGVEAVLAAAAAGHRLFHETGAAPWAGPARRLDLRQYAVFVGPPPA
jgi:predicted dehydrogenase